MRPMSRIVPVATLVLGIGLGFGGAMWLGARGESSDRVRYCKLCGRIEEQRRGAETSDAFDETGPLARLLAAQGPHTHEMTEWAEMQGPPDPHAPGAPVAAQVREMRDFNTD